MRPPHRRDDDHEILSAELGPRMCPVAGPVDAGRLRDRRIWRHGDGQRRLDRPKWNHRHHPPGQHNSLATYVFQPLVFTGNLILLPTYEVSWRLDAGAGTWSAN